MFSKRLKELRKKFGLTQEELARRIGVERSSVGKYESTSTIPSVDVLEAMSEVFDVSIDFLLGRVSADHQPERESSTGGVWIPVLGKVAAGVPITAVEEVIDYEEISAEMAASGEFMALSVKGDSMEPRIKNGDVVIVKLQPDVDSGQVAVVMVNGDEATVKKVVKQENGIVLVANNPAYAPRFYSSRDIEQLPLKIVGRVVELRGKF